MNREELEKAKREGRKVLYTDWLGRKLRGSISDADPRSNPNNYVPGGFDSVSNIVEVHDGRFLEPGGYELVDGDLVELAPPDILKVHIDFDLEVNTDEYRLAHPDMPRRPIMGPDYEKAIRDAVYEFLGKLTGDEDSYRGETMKATNVRVFPR